MLRLTHLTEGAISAQSDSGLLCLEQSKSSTAAWRLRIYARTAEGRGLLGELVTVPPSVGEPPDRALAALYAPGVERWDVEAELFHGDADDARLTIGVGREGQGGPGLVALFKRFEVLELAAGSPTVAIPRGYHVERVSAFTGGVAGSVQIAGHGAAAPIPASAALTLEPRGTAHGPTSVVAVTIGGGTVECVRW